MVMLLTVVDYAAHMFNDGQYVTDSVAVYQAGCDTPAVQFPTRWITHRLMTRFIITFEYRACLNPVGFMDCMHYKFNILNRFVKTLPILYDALSPSLSPS
jgi:hypothetical protein